MSVSKLLVNQIRSLLKLKQITYAQLAKKLGVSESTVKRWLSSKSFSLEQLDQICKAMNISAEDLIGNSKGLANQPFFTREQEDLMAGNEKSLVAFYLVSLGKSFATITDQYDFTEAELWKLARQLETVGLVEIRSNNKVVALASAGTNWIPEGKIAKKYFHKIREDFTDSYFNGPSEMQFFTTGPLTESSSRLIMKKVNELSREIREIYQMDANETHEPNVSIFFGMRPWRFSVIENYRLNLRK